MIQENSDRVAPQKIFVDMCWNIKQLQAHIFHQRIPKASEANGLAIVVDLNLPDRTALPRQVCAGMVPILCFGKGR